MSNRTVWTAIRLPVAVLGMVAACLALAVPCLAVDDVPGGDVLLSTLEGSDSMSALAYNSHAQEFLVVWSHEGDIYGQRYTYQGVPQGGNFRISTASSYQVLPSVAYSLAADSYLVVWEDLRGDQGDIYGQLVDADGTLLDNPSTPGIVETDPALNFAVYAGAGTQRYPDLDFDGDRYLVAWQSDVDGAADIVARFVDDDGTVDPTVLSIGGAGDAVHRQQPKVAYNAMAGEYLVVYQYDFGAQAQVLARRVDPGEYVFPSEYTVVAQPGAGTPDVAAANWGAYVVVWSDDRQGEGDVYGRVALAGSNNFDGGDFAISTAYADQSLPRIARSPSTGQFLVVWQDDRLHQDSGWDLYAQRLLADANLASTNFVVDAAPGDQHEVAIAAGQEPGLYFVAWQDRRSGSSDIYGQRVAASGSLLWHDFAISARLDNQIRPDVAYNADTDEYMAVWEDTSAGEIYYQRLSAEGQPLEEPQPIWNRGGITLDPAIATKGSFWMVAWRDVYTNAIGYCPLYSQGGVVTTLTVPNSAGGSEPELAYLPSDDLQHESIFLMVWQQGGDIYGGTHDTGIFHTGPFVISSGGPVKSDPNVASDPEHHQFLVVWEESVAGQPSILGRLITSEGGFATAKFQIAVDAGINYWQPSASYNADDDQWLVVFQRSDGTEADIYGRRLNWDGPPVDLNPFLVWDGEAGNDQSSPDVIYVPSAQRYYVLWADDRNEAESGVDLYGRWLEADGSPGSGVRPFFRYPGNQEGPILAYDPEHERALAVWDDNRRYTYDAYARLGVLDVTPPVAGFFHVPFRGQPGTTFLFNARPSHDDATPRGALAVRWDWESDGKWDTEWSLDKVVTHTVGLPLGKHVVALQVRDLVSYTATITHPVWILPAGGKGPTASLTADANWASAGVPLRFDASASAAAGAEAVGALQVAWDWESDGEWDEAPSPILTATHAFTVAGDYTVRAEVEDADGLTGAAFYNVTVLPGAPIHLEISPPEATMGPGQAIRFRATTWDTYGNKMATSDVTWSVTEPAAGMIDATGVFTASLMQSAAHPDLILAESNGVTGTATVIIVWPYRLYLPLVLRGYE